MAIARGSKFLMAVAREPSPGVTPTDNWALLPVASFGLTGSRGFLDAPWVGQGLDAARPKQGDLDIGGSVVTPVDATTFPYWLCALFGQPTTTGDGPYTHRWRSGADDTGSLSIERSHPDLDTPLHQLFSGVRVRSLNLELAPSGDLRATFDLVAENASDFETTQRAAAPAVVTYDEFVQYENFARLDNAPLSRGTNLSLTTTNNVEGDRYIGGKGAFGDFTPGLAEANGQITTRLDGASLLDKVKAGDDVDLTFGVERPGEVVGFWAPNCALTLAGSPVDGPGGLSVNFDYRAFGTSANPALEIQVISTTPNFPIGSAP